MILGWIHSQRPSDGMGIPYGYLDPLLDYDPLPSWPDVSLESAIPGWRCGLKTFRIGQKSVDDALVLPVGVVVEGVWLSDCVQYLPRHWQEAPWMQFIAGHRLVNDSAGLRLEPETPLPPVLLKGCWCVLNDFVGNRNMAHFFHDELPQLAAIVELRKAVPSLKVLARTSIHANINLLRELLLPGGLIDARPGGEIGAAPPLQLETLLLQPNPFNGGVGCFPSFERYMYWLAPNEVRAGLSLLRQSLEKRCNQHVGFAGHWICFSRNLHIATQAPQGRRYTNYPQLLETLSNNGVIVLDPGCFSILDLYGLINRARGFVGIHGAGLANALLASEGARVVEIRTPCGVNPSLELMGRTTGLDWHPVATPSASDGSERGVIPIETVMDLISDSR